MAKKSDNQTLPEALSQFTLDLIQDIKDLRAGKITNTDARARALLAREALRAVHLQLEGMKWLSGSAKALPSPDAKGAA